MLTIFSSLSGSNKTKCSTDLINGFDMLKFFLILVVFIFFNLAYVPFVNASSNYEVKDFLSNREQTWPDWYLSDLQSSNTKNDLIYPSWFEGQWIITSENLKNSSEKKISYEVEFYQNELGQIIGNRSKNAESIGKAIFGERLKKVKTDPNSFNDQVTYLSNNEYIESRIKERTQVFDDDLFFADEFVIQTVHNPEASRINQVEVMSKFYRCKDSNLYNGDIKEICGLQFLATYGSKVGEKNTKAISQSKYKLTFKYLGKKR